MEKRLASYLLGDLSEEERIKIEEEYYSDEDKYLGFEAAQNDLIDAYVRGELSHSEREGFEKNFLNSPWQRKRVGVARALAEFAGATGSGAADAGVRPARPGFRKLFRKILSSFSAWQFALATASLVVAATVVWLTLQNVRLQNELARVKDKQSTADQQNAAIAAIEDKIAQERSRADHLASELDVERKGRAELESELSGQSSSGAYPALLSIVLAPQTLRSGGTMKRITVAPNVNAVRLQLSLPVGELHSAYRAEIQTPEGKTIYSRGGLRVGNLGSSRIVIVNVPATLLDSNDFSINLSGLSATGKYEEAASYSLRVTKRSARTQ